MRRVPKALAAILVMVSALPALAVQPDEILPDTALEARARGISAGLRCLVCQNQSIDDSDAPLARDLRILVRERLKAGDSDTDVRNFIVDRYGDFVLLKPPFTLATALLWFMPLLLLAGAALMIWRNFQPASPTGTSGRLTPEEQARLDALLSKDE
jgi:cytochrome c-type biogenesis protein CcmH